MSVLDTAFYPVIPGNLTASTVSNLKKKNEVLRNEAHRQLNLN